MHATDVIDSYIDDTVRLLPRRQRDDVATELRALLNEELHARAQESGRPPDESLALSLVRGYGHPNEVAARYQPPWAIIDPADSTSFVRAAIIGAGALVLLSAISRLRPSPPGTADNLVTIGILVWLGVLVVAFGAKNWIRRRWPATALWEPRDRDRVNRLGTAMVVPIATFFVVLYAAPTWVLDQISGGRFDTSWAAYTADFQRLAPSLLHRIDGRPPRPALVRRDPGPMASAHSSHRSSASTWPSPAWSCFSPWTATFSSRASLTRSHETCSPSSPRSTCRVWASTLRRDRTSRPRFTLRRKRDRHSTSTTSSSHSAPVCPTPSGSKNMAPHTRSFFLFLPNKLHPTAHVLRRRAIFPAGALHLDVVVVDEGEGRFVHVFVLVRVEVVAAGELEDDLVRRRLRVGLHARLVAQHAVMRHGTSPAR